MLKKTSSRDEDEPPDEAPGGYLPYVDTPVVNNKASFCINFLPRLKVLSYKFYYLILQKFLIFCFILFIIICYQYSFFSFKINSCHRNFFYLYNFIQTGFLRRGYLCL